MIALACDHHGIALKQEMMKMLDEMGLKWKDFGTYDVNSQDDYPVYGCKAAKAVASGECNRGILICGTGMGISIAAGKVKGIRVCTCSDVYSAEMGKRHNNSNILTMGALVVGTELAKMIARYWLTAEFEGGRHQRRIDMIEKIENGEDPEIYHYSAIRKDNPNVTHSMQLQPAPFEMIRDGTKTIELRLFDEKRKKIRIGDTISFTNTVSKEILNVKVLELSVFDSFETLYIRLPLLECGYTTEDVDTASPDDMNAYYSKEMQQKYGVVGIKIALL